DVVGEHRGADRRTRGGPDGGADRPAEEEADGSAGPGAGRAADDEAGITGHGRGGDAKRREGGANDEELAHFEFLSILYVPPGQRLGAEPVPPEGWAQSAQLPTFSA